MKQFTVEKISVMTLDSTNIHSRKKCLLLALCVHLLTVLFACAISVGGSRTHSKGSLTSEAKVPPESDTDSMAEYGEGEAGSSFFF